MVEEEKGKRGSREREWEEERKNGIWLKLE
jgi:hypothetical protein